MLTPMLSNKEPHCSLGHYRVIISLLVYEVVSAPTWVRFKCVCGIVPWSLAKGFWISLFMLLRRSPGHAEYDTREMSKAPGPAYYSPSKGPTQKSFHMNARKMYLPRTWMVLVTLSSLILQFCKSRNLEICMVIRSLLPISMETMHDPKEPVFLIALRIMRHAMLCLLVIMFLICVCWHPERMCRALSTYGQRGQVWFVESLNNTHIFDYIGCLFCIS